MRGEDLSRILRRFREHRSMKTWSVPDFGS